MFAAPALHLERSGNSLNYTPVRREAMDRLDSLLAGTTLRTETLCPHQELDQQLIMFATFRFVLNCGAHPFVCPSWTGRP